MLERTRSRQVFYDAIRSFARYVCVVLFRVRCHDYLRVPSSGALLVCSNHQSTLDPILVGIASRRRLNYLARQTLFRFGPFGWLIRSLDAIPLERDGLGIGGLKESLRRLKQGEGLVIFPEGTRSADGDVQPLKPGFCMLARRSAVSVVPVGIDGAFDVWPRSSRFPHPGPVHIVVGEPISPEWIQQSDDAELVAEVERRIRACHARARAARLR
jgi:1-acyl-sn-glycerol-3-phosphate acyltransferase